MIKAKRYGRTNYKFENEFVFVANCTKNKIHLPIINFIK